MPSGGARARSGPPPDPGAIRRDRKTDSGSWTQLPAAGRVGKPPAWPLDGQSKREREIWAREWKRPQALMWAANGQELEVALYVRSIVEAERPMATTAARTLVRQQMDSLGLTLPGLLRNRWVITDVTDQRIPRNAAAAPSTARDRLKVLQGGGS